jgi:hypothetical protein
MADCNPDSLLDDRGVRLDQLAMGRQCADVFDSGDEKWRYFSGGTCARTIGPISGEDTDADAG